METRRDSGAGTGTGTVGVLSASSVMSSSSSTSDEEEEVDGEEEYTEEYEAKAVYLFSVNRVYAHHHHHHHPVRTYVLTHCTRFMLLQSRPRTTDRPTNLSVYLPAKVFIGNVHSFVRGCSRSPFHPQSTTHPLDRTATKHHYHPLSYVCPPVLLMAVLH